MVRAVIMDTGKHSLNENRPIPEGSGRTSEITVREDRPRGPEEPGIAAAHFLEKSAV
jgi:hypothetical protein